MAGLLAMRWSNGFLDVHKLEKRRGSTLVVLRAWPRVCKKYKAILRQLDSNDKKRQELIRIACRPIIIANAVSVLEDLDFYHVLREGIRSIFTGYNAR